MTTASATTLVPEEAVSVSVASLVRLARPAQGLSLRRSEIRSLKSDAYQSRVKGRGMEYDESRLYQPGDDVRHLDWRVTARTGKAHTKLFCEERERPVFLWVDCRAPMFFATRGRLKTVAAAETAALLAWSAAQEGDRVGGVVFSSGEVCRELRPRRGRGNVLRLIHELAAASAPEHLSRGDLTDGDLTDETRSAGRALSHLSHLVRPGSLVFMISDFRGIDDAGERAMRRLTAHSEVFFIFISDPVEQKLPPPGNYRISDGERDLHFDTDDPEFAAAYAERFRSRFNRWRTVARKARAGFLQCRTFEDPLEVLKKDFGARPR